MARKQRGQIVETATEARQAELGPSVLALLIISTGLAIVSCLSPCYAGPIEMSISWKIDATKVSVS